TEGNYRSYRQEHLERLRFIRNCRTLDMTHAEIRALLAFVDRRHGHCAPVNSLLDEQTAHDHTRLADLQRRRKELTGLPEQCADATAIEDCGIILGLTSMATEEKRPSGSHLG